jgi:hypothetical protein
VQSGCRPKLTSAGGDPLAVINSNNYFECAPLDDLRTTDLWDARIPEGILDTTTGALEVDGSTIIQTIVGPMHPNRYQVRRWGRPRSTPSRHDAILPLIGDNSSGQNYYHWIVDILPRASVLQCLEPHLRPTIIVPDNRNSFVDESLALLDERYGIRDISYCKNGQRLRFTDAYLAAYPLRDFGAVLPPALVHWIRDVFQTEDILSRRRKRRIYIRRDPSKGPRYVANEAELISLIDHLGFEVVEPESMPLRSQATLFAEAEMVLAPHGAGLANTVFCRDAHIFELVAPGLAAPHFAYLSFAAGNTYVPLRCATDTGNGYVADIRAVKFAIEQLLEQRPGEVSGDSSAAIVEAASNDSNGSVD